MNMIATRVWSNVSISTITRRLGSQYIKMDTIKNVALRESITNGHLLFVMGALIL